MWLPPTRAATPTPISLAQRIELLRPIHTGEGMDLTERVIKPSGPATLTIELSTTTATAAAAITAAEAVSSGVSGPPPDSTSGGPSPVETITAVGTSKTGTPKCNFRPRCYGTWAPSPVGLVSLPVWVEERRCHRTPAAARIARTARAAMAYVGVWKPLATCCQLLPTA